MIKPKKALEDISPDEDRISSQQWRLKLDKNENIYGCAGNILSVIRNISPEEIACYPNYEKALNKFAEKYNLEKNNILFANGSRNALKNVIETYLDENDKMVSIVDLNEDIISEVKIIHIETPDSQTGQIIRASDIELLLKKYENKLFVVNCSYSNYSNVITFEDYIDLTKNYNNIVVIKSYSNDFAIAGLRFAVIISADSIISNLKKMVLPYNVNSIAINCALMILNDDKRLDELKELNNGAKNLFEEILQKNDIEFYKSEANFILCNFKDYCDFYYEKFKKQSVITKKYKNNSAFEKHLRITIPTVGGVKFIGELLNKKDVLVFDTKNVLFNEEKLLISIDRLKELSKKYDLVVYSCEHDFELFKKYDLENCFYGAYLSKDVRIIEFLNKIPHNTIKFFSADINSIIQANLNQLETIGIIPSDSNHQAMINNYRHLGINYIMDEINNIENFLNPQLEALIE